MAAYMATTEAKTERLAREIDGGLWQTLLLLFVFSRRSIGSVRGIMHNGATEGVVLFLLHILDLSHTVVMHTYLWSFVCQYDCHDLQACSHALLLLIVSLHRLPPVLFKSFPLLHFSLCLCLSFLSLAF